MPKGKHLQTNFTLDRVHRSEKLLGQKDLRSHFVDTWGHLIRTCNLSHQDPEQETNLHS